jgi:hypothetical protein
MWRKAPSPAIAEGLPPLDPRHRYKLPVACRLKNAGEGTRATLPESPTKHPVISCPHFAESGVQLSLQALGKLSLQNLSG